MTTSMCACRILGATALISLITAGTGLAADDETPSASPAPPDHRVTTAEEALAAMKGMGGSFRVSPDGDYFLYPYSPVDEVPRHHPGLSGMQGMDAMHGIDAMGGVPGYFQIQRSGEVHFYPYPGEPVGMSGMRGTPTSP